MMEKILTRSHEDAMFMKSLVDETDKSRKVYNEERVDMFKNMPSTILTPGAAEKKSRI